MTADSVAHSDTEQSSAEASAVRYTHKNTHTCLTLWKPGEVRLVPGGRKQITHCATHAHTLAHKCIYARTHVCTCTHTYTQAAQLGLNGVSLLTYFFTVTQRQTLGTLALNINSAIKLFAWCECLGSRGGSNLTAPSPIFPVVRRQKQKEAPFCRLEVLTASYSLQQPSCLFVCVHENNRE